MPTANKDYCQINLTIFSCSRKATVLCSSCGRGLVPFSTENGCKSTREPFLYHLKAVECFLTLNFGITDYDIVHLNWPDFSIVSAILV